MNIRPGFGQSYFETVMYQQITRNHIVGCRSIKKSLVIEIIGDIQHRNFNCDMPAGLNRKCQIKLCQVTVKVEDTCLPSAPSAFKRNRLRVSIVLLYCMTFYNLRNCVVRNKVKTHTVLALRALISHDVFFYKCAY